MRRSLYCFLLCILLLSACTGKRYGHYGYIKKDTTKAQKNYRKSKLLAPETIALKEVEAKIGVADSVEKHNISANNTKEVIVNKSLYTERVFGKEEQINIPKFYSDTLDKLDEKKFHPKAEKSLERALTGLFVLLIPGIGLFLSMYFEIRAFITAIRALKEIKKNPEKFKGKNKAIVAIAISAFMFLVYILLGYFFYVFVTTF